MPPLAARPLCEADDLARQRNNRARICEKQHAITSTGVAGERDGGMSDQDNGCLKPVTLVKGAVEQSACSSSSVSEPGWYGQT